MASELKSPKYSTGATVYAVVRRASDGKVWNTAGTPAFENISNANWTDYDIAGVEQSTTGYYYANMPAGISSAASLQVDWFVQAGGSPASTDSLFGSQLIEWDGSAEITLSGVPAVNATKLAGTAYASADFSATMKASINTEADTALADVGLTTTVTGRIDVAVSTRLATSGYTAPLDAAGTRMAIGLASANLDTQLTAIDDYLDTEVAAIKAKTDQLTFTTSNKVDAKLTSDGLDLVIPAEPAGPPTWASSTIVQWVSWIGAFDRNKKTQTATTATLRNFADNANLATAAVSDNGTTFTISAWS